MCGTVRNKTCTFILRSNVHPEVHLEVNEMKICMFAEIIVNTMYGIEIAKDGAHVAESMNCAV